MVTVPATTPGAFPARWEVGILFALAGCLVEVLQKTRLMKVCGTHSTDAYSSFKQPQKLSARGALDVPHNYQPRIARALVLFLAFVQPTVASFTRAACYRNDCLQINRDGHLCYYPSPDTDHVGHVKCANRALSKVLETHIAPAPSRIATTAYYDLQTGTHLGGSTWLVSNAPQVQKGASVAVCHTGLMEGTKFYSTCRVAAGDDDFDSTNAQKTACGREHGHDERVLREKCCGGPRLECPPTQEPIWKRILANGWVQWFAIVFAGAVPLAVFVRRVQ